MKFGVVNKSTILNKLVPHILQRKITHLTVIIRRNNSRNNKTRCFERGGAWKRASSFDAGFTFLCFGSLLYTTVAASLFSIASPLCE